MKRKPIRKKSKNELPNLKRLAWEVFSKYIRMRDKYKCFTCGKVEKPGQAGHRWHDKLDFDPINVNCQCVRCNKWLHGNLGEYERNLIEKYGIDVVDDLRKRAHKIYKYERYELIAIRCHWEEELEKLENREAK